MDKRQPPFWKQHFDKVAATYADAQESSPMTKIARVLISLAPPISSKSVVLDNASGPGIITGEILRQATAGELPEMYAVDISPNMIEELRKKNWPGVKSDVMDAQKLSHADNTFTHSFMNLAIFLLPEPEKGTREIFRTLKPGGVAVITSIKKTGWIRLFQAAQKAAKPDEPVWEGPLATEWSTSQKLKKVVQAGGFKEEDIEVKMTEASQPSNLMSVFLDSMRVSSSEMITKGWGIDEKAKFQVALDEQLRAANEKPQELEVNVWIAVARK